MFLKYMDRKFTMLIERDGSGNYVASVVELPGCHTQAKTWDELMTRIKECIQLCLEKDVSDLPAPSSLSG
jgi:predicted RNase H-like HicB family nuclease